MRRKPSKPWGFGLTEPKISLLQAVLVSESCFFFLNYVTVNVLTNRSERSEHSLGFLEVISSFKGQLSSGNSDSGMTEN